MAPRRVTKETTLKRARMALARRLQETSGLTLDSKGYVAHWKQNLLPGIDPQWCEAELEEGAGKELAGKFRAAYSSSALAVNTFARLKTACRDLTVGDWSGCEFFRFEAKCPAGIIGRHGLESPPHLDLLARSAPSEPPGERTCSMLAIESKCTEHLKSRKPKFSPAYGEYIREGDARRKSPWFELMQQMRATDYCHLDAAQLIKHAFGLVHSFPDCDVTLLYLYWEPKNADDLSEFKDHQDEIRRFEEQVKGSAPLFRPMSYRELWEDWSRTLSPPWLREHVKALRDRYDVEI
jgi:hypothetical protein